MKTQLLYSLILLTSICTLNAQISLVKDINMGSGDSNPNQLFSFKDKLYFTASSASGFDLYTSDGTESGTEVKVNFSSGYFNGFSLPIIFNNEMYFKAKAKDGGILIKTDGTNFSSVVQEIFPVFGADINGFIVYKDELYFSASEAFTARQRLYKTDGTAEGTLKVKDIESGSLTDVKYEKIVYNDMLYFTGKDADNGIELWKSDGSEAGTTLVKDINPGTSSSTPYRFTIANNILFFMAETADNGRELWKTDGTEAGTVLVKDIRTGTSNSDPKEFTLYKNRLYFLANDGTRNKLWVTDGTENGTTLFKDIELNNTTFSSIVYKDQLFFAAKDGDFGFELWTSDGTPESTTMLKDISPGDRNDNGNPNNFFIYKNELFFEAYTDELGDELYKTDGTAEGTVLIADINTGRFNFAPQRFAIHNDILFFSGDGGDGGGSADVGRELFKYEDATASTNSDFLEKVNIFADNDNTVHIKGLQTSKSTLRIVNLLGKEMKKVNFTSNGNASIKTNLISGVYILNINTEKGNISKKILIK